MMKIKSGKIGNVNKKLLAGTLALVFSATMLTGCNNKKNCNELHLDTKLVKSGTNYITHNSIKDGLRQSFFEENSIIKDINKSCYVNVYKVLEQEPTLQKLKNTNAVLSFIELYLNEKTEQLGYLSDSEYADLLNKCGNRDKQYAYYNIEFNKDYKKYSLEINLNEGEVDSKKAIVSDHELIKQTIDNGNVNLSKSQKIETDGIVGLENSRYYYLNQSYVIRDSEENYDISVSLDNNYRTGDGYILSGDYKCRDYKSTLSIRKNNEIITTIIDENQSYEFARIMAGVVDQNLTTKEFILNNNERLIQLFDDKYDEFIEFVTGLQNKQR